MKNWKKLNDLEMDRINGEGFLLTAWFVGLVSLIIIKGIFSDKGSAAVNGLGKISWENNKKKTITTKNDNLGKSKNIDKEKTINNLFNKFYEF